MKTYKNINPRFLKKLPTEVYKSRVSIYDMLEQQDYSTGLKNVSKFERSINIHTLGLLVREVWRRDGKYNLEGLSFRPEVDIKADVDDILYNLIGSKHTVMTSATLDKIDLVMSEYDMTVTGNFYFNTTTRQPLHVYRIGDVQVIYRGWTYFQIDQFLRELAFDLGEYFSFTEPFFIMKSRSFALKEEAVRRFCSSNIFPTKDVKFYQNVICDAYNNIISICSQYLDENKNIRLDMLQSVRQAISDHIVNAYDNGRYKFVFTQRQVDSYEHLIHQFEIAFNKVIHYIKFGGVKPYDIEDYYFTETKMTDCNKIKVNYGHVKHEVCRLLHLNKVICSIIETVHPDIVCGIYLMCVHCDLLGIPLYVKDKSLPRLISLLVSRELKTRPLLIKYVFKVSNDALLHDMKEQGLILFHQLENFFGYRVTSTILDEVNKDFRSWFDEKISDFSEIQYKFISKWAASFFESFNYKGRKISDIMQRNMSHYPDFNSILGDSTQYFKGHGVAQGFKAETIKGKNVSVTKNQYFNLFKSFDEYETSCSDYPKVNKVVIKREELIKQRIVINTSMRTFNPLSKINKFLSVLYSGTGIIYPFNNKSQKSEHYVRLSNYLLFNKYARKRFLCMPLDYSSYDHTITKGFIKAVIEQSAKAAGYSSELAKLSDDFFTKLDEEIIYFKELDGHYPCEEKYKYGMLSGWKITSSVESIGNAIVSYGIMNELGLHLHDIETMGDDLIIIVDGGDNDRATQLKVLQVVCEKYQELGFKMNVPKNSIGYWFLEFLRVTFMPGIVQCYPTRILGALLYMKPGREEANFGIIEIQAVLKKVCKRYGISSAFVSLAKMFLPYYNHPNIRKFGLSYITDPASFEISRYRVPMREYKVKTIETPVFKRYIDLLGEEFSSNVQRYIEKNLVVENVDRYDIVPHKKQQPLSEVEKATLRFIFSNFKKNIITRVQRDNFYLPDYHLVNIICSILKKRKVDIEWAKRWLSSIFTKMASKSFFRQVDLSLNLRIISECSNVTELLSRFVDDKVLVEEKNIPSLIFSRIKLAFTQHLKMLMNNFNLDKQVREMIHRLLHRSRNYMMRVIVSEFLADRSEVLALGMGLPLSFLAD